MKEHFWVALISLGIGIGVMDKPAKPTLMDTVSVSDTYLQVRPWLEQSSRVLIETGALDQSPLKLVMDETDRNPGKDKNAKDGDDA